MTIQKGFLALLFWGFLISLFFMGRKSFVTETYPVYSGSDLGVTYSPLRSAFRVWAPTATDVTLRVYEQGLGGEAYITVTMKPGGQGTWVALINGDLKGKYYTYQAVIKGKRMEEVTDPYARSAGANGLRGMVVDFESVDPSGWEQDKRPVLNSFKDIVIWEIHVRDFSQDPSSGILNRGKYLGFTEEGTRTISGEKTGIDHLVDLGVTHVHLLPVFDYASVDETKLNSQHFNWGYDPQNFNVPEGSYSTNPFDGSIRVTEFKQMVMALHKKGIRVIMDVVYNHTSTANFVPFNQLVPNYYYRQTPQGKPSDASGCGNETASERPMVRKYMVESVKFWAEEYHIDGFRFDLMAIHDIETMNLIRDELNAIDPTIYMYGEGWMASKTPLPLEKQSIKEHAFKLNGIGVFSDEMRDGLRGRWMEHDEKGFLLGNGKLTESVKYGIVGGVNHQEIDFNKVIYSGRSYVANPSQFISYVSCHDNPCLWDKIAMLGAELPVKERLKLQKLANGIVLTSQGIAFLHAGEEMVRTKKMVENSYNSPDSINSLIWSNKSLYPDVYQYYKKMIGLRKNHPAFRMETTSDINNNLSFLISPNSSVIVYRLNGEAVKDSWKDIVVAINVNDKDSEVLIPDGKWVLVANGDAISEDGIDSKVYSQKINVPSRTMVILKR